MGAYTYQICHSPNPSPHIKLQLLFSVEFAITFTEASLLKSASRLILPYSTQTLIAPHALPMPVRWAPQLPPPRVRSRTQNSVASSAMSPALTDSMPHSLNLACLTHPDQRLPCSSVAAPAHFGSTGPLPSAYCDSTLVNVLVIAWAVEDLLSLLRHSLRVLFEKYP
jgi:hypothetical protein